MYIHQLKEWPNFNWNQERLFQRLTEIRHHQGRLIGRMESLGFSLQKEATLQTMTIEVLKSSEIEEVKLDPDQVRSSIARRLGMEIAGLIREDRDVEGVVEMAIDATQKFNEPLTDERLFGWHSALFPTGRSGMSKIVVGTWRTNELNDPMQVVSGAMGKEKIHFEAPESKLLSKEMKTFLKWFEEELSLDAVIKAGIAHLWFVTIHPFEDGNGRIARAITDMQLARADGIPQRFYSLSAQIRLRRKDYYDILEKTQKGTLDVTEWLEWFLTCLDEAFKAAEETLSVVLRKARYWELLATKNINDRQRLLINKMLDQFEGKLTTTKYAKIAKCSSDTALRDIQNLIGQGILIKEAGGSKNTSYILKEIN